MVVLRVVPAGAKRRLPFALFILGGLYAFLDRARRLATIVAGRSAALGVGREGHREEGEGEEEVTGVEEHLLSFEIVLLLRLHALCTEHFHLHLDELCRRRVNQGI